MEIFRLYSNVEFILACKIAIENCTNKTDLSDIFNDIVDIADTFIMCDWEYCHTFNDLHDLHVAQFRTLPAINEA